MQWLPGKVTQEQLLMGMSSSTFPCDMGLAIGTDNCH